MTFEALVRARQLWHGASLLFQRVKYCAEVGIDGGDFHQRGPRNITDVNVVVKIKGPRVVWRNAIALKRCFRKHERLRIRVDLEFAQQRRQKTVLRIEPEFNVSLLDSLLQTGYRAVRLRLAVGDRVLVKGSNVGRSLEIVGQHDG